MFKLPTKLFVALLAIATTFLMLYLQPLSAKAILSNSVTTPQPKLIATAATAPRLENAILGGKPISVLYITRNSDTVLVRCYPNYQPVMKIRAMGSKPNANTQQEGVMTCQPTSTK
ncbi:hypothetical protein H6F42_16940 [Pseudanabaena sp. FACHB-1998]|uniref:hypothetical protein n=1 Tax=Pseudanabaena sp. FACHB-1998 TaxID=2692858 RepID=UPI0016811253|nr:hypothetical protein [Pseudanabaena sp. FACHB-1998]MBD2178606.1 hypothetical protein [Pseudanabaena sp. FACHB-1998]